MGPRVLLGLGAAFLIIGFGLINIAAAFIVSGLVLVGVGVLFLDVPARVRQ